MLSSPLDSFWNCDRISIGFKFCANAVYSTDAAKFFAVALFCVYCSKNPVIAASTSADTLNGIETKDILTLLEMSISDLGHQMEVLVKLKLLNKKC